MSEDLTLLDRLGSTDPGYRSEAGPDAVLEILRLRNVVTYLYAELAENSSAYRGSPVLALGVGGISGFVSCALCFWLAGLLHSWWGCS
jgi:hypothetical protein